jgi:hypothetical protein
MIIRGVTRQDLEAARDVASLTLCNTLVFSKLRSYSPAQLRYGARLQVRDMDGPGARRHSHAYASGFTDRPRRSRFACAHAYGHLFVAIFERCPEARIHTAFADYKEWRDFLAKYRGVIDMNVGSTMFPVRHGDECACESDEVPTDTLDDYLWRRGAPQMPIPANTETVKC